MNLADFLENYKEELKDKVLNKLDPVYKGDVLNFSGLKRNPIKAQAKAVSALVKGYRSGKNSLFLIGEMGVGKTFMALATAYLVGAKRILVMCPPHLVQKWIREAEMTIPDVKTYDLTEKGLGVLREIKKNGWGKPDAIEVYVISGHKAKLHYRNKPALNYKTSKGYVEDEEGYGSTYRTTINVPACPNCGKDLTEYRDFDRANVEKRIVSKKLHCPFCGTPLYQADKDDIRRYAKAKFISEYLKGYFDFFIADEIHESKAGTSAQGNAFGMLASTCKRTLALTGTLMGGYAKDIYYLLWRAKPSQMREKGFDYYKEIDFAEKYGIIEETHEVEKDSADHAYSIGGTRKRIVRKKEKPGVSPALLTDFLLDCSVFMRLSDISSKLPDFEEEVRTIPMMDKQRSEYDTLENNLTDYVRRALMMGNRSAISKLLQPLLAYPDGARAGEEVLDGSGGVIASAEALEVDLLPKEEQLLEIIKQESEEGRKVLVYVEYTGKRDIIPTLATVIENAGYNVAYLYSKTVSSGKREEWVNKKVHEGDIDVLITNPRLVQTGLDLIDFPTIVFFQTRYSIYTLRQASRRSWRIGQDKPVKVYYLVYEDSMQEKALQLVANKLETSLAVEGVLSDKGLAGMSENAESSIVIELAKKLVEEDGDDNDRSLSEAFSRVNMIEIENDSELTDDTPTSVETTITKGERKAKVTYKRVQRGKVKVFKDVLTGKMYAVAIVDGRHKLLFREGKVFYNKKVVGEYNKDGKGKIRGKPVELLKSKNGYTLYELHEASL